MRKILTFPRNGIAAAKSAVRNAKLFAIGAGLAVTFCMASAARAQTLAEYLAPTATNAQSGPVSTAVARGMESLPTVDASYSLLNDQTQVVPAQATAFIPGPDGVPYAPGCDINWYFGAEAVYLQRRNDKNFSLSRNIFLPDWDYEIGGRFTVGRLFDCTNGWDFTYVGSMNWDRQNVVNLPGGLQSTFFPILGYTPAQISAFGSGLDNTFADTHIQNYSANLDSFEVNRRWVVWDVISTALGIRYLEYDEEYKFFSSRAGVGTGLIQDRVENRLLGGQFAADMTYPVSLRANAGFKFKGGAYANFAEQALRLENAGTLVLNAGSTKTDWAGIFELGAFANYSIVPSVRLSIGYEVWWLPGIATVPEQMTQIINPSSGSSTQSKDSLIIQGGSAGVQILF